jgi:6-phosphofructokinase
MASIKNIGIITSGGDCGGLNAVVGGAAPKARYNHHRAAHKPMPDCITS